MPRLFVLSGDDLGRTFDFDRAVVLGRAETADLRLRSVSISRHHARVEPDPASGGWRVVDLDSRNGVAVEGRKVPAAPLTEGGVFVLGDIEVRFRAEGAPAMGTPIVLAPGTGAPGAGAPGAAAPGAAAPDSVGADPAVSRASELAETGAHEPVRRHVPPPPVTPEADDELELEGDWEDVVPPPPTAPAPRAAASAAASPRAGASGPADVRRAAAAGGAAAPAQRERDARRAELLRGSRASGAPKAASAGGGARPVLQYHRTEGSSGVLGADLAQRPWWVRAGVWVLGLGLLVGLAYGALEVTRKLRASEATLVAPESGDRSE